MLTKNIKYPYVKFGFDVVGVLASIGIFLIFVFNTHANFGSDGSSSFGINVTGSSMVLLSSLILIVVICGSVAKLEKYS